MDTIQQYRQKYPQFNNVPDEALGKAVYEQHYADKMPREEFDTKFGLSPRVSTGEDVLRSIVTGAGEAVHAFPGMLGGLFGAGMQLGGWIDRKTGLGEMLGTGPAASSEEIAQRNPLEAITPQAFEHYSGFEDIKHQPQTKAGEFAKTAANFITPVAPLGVNQLIRLGIREGIRPAINTVTKLGVAPAVVSETAKQTAKKYAPGWEDAAAVLGGLVGGGVAAVLSRPSNAAAVIKSYMPRGVTNADINAADAIVQEGLQRGVTVTWPEALSQATNGRVDVTGLQRIVEQTRGGGPIMAETMSQRGPQTRTSTGGAMNELTAGRQMVDPTIAGQTIRRTAEESLVDLRQRINATAEPYYNAAANTRVPVPRALANDPVYQRALAAVRADDFHSRPIRGLPDDSVGVLNEIKKYLDARATEAAARPGGNYTAAGLGELARDTRGAAVAASRDYERALGLETDLRQRFLNPAEGGPLGKLSRTEDITKQGRAVINSTAEGSEQRIQHTIGLLSQRAPDAAFQLVRNHIRGAFDAASGGVNEQWRGGNFSKAILGNPQEAANLEAAIRALPDGAARWDGFRAFLDVMEATGRRAKPNSTTAFSGQTMREMERGGIPGEAIEVTRSLGSRLMDYYKEWNLGNVSQSMARMFTDPRSAGMLRRLAEQRTPAGRRAIAAYLIAYYGGQQSGDVIHPPVSDRLAKVPALDINSGTWSPPLR